MNASELMDLVRKTPGEPTQQPVRMCMICRAKPPRHKEGYWCQECFEDVVSSRVRACDDCGVLISYKYRKLCTPCYKKANT